MNRHWRAVGDLRATIIGGVSSGLLGALLFATAHALIIVPIWTRMWSGLLWGAVVGLTAAWALVETVPAVRTGSASRVMALGAAAGGLLWLLVAPVTVVDLLLRHVGVAEQNEYIRIVVAVTLAIAAGGAVAWWRARRWRAALAGALTTLSLTIAMAGPVPIGRSPRALWIFLAVLPASVLAGVLLAVAVRLAERYPLRAEPHSG